MNDKPSNGRCARLIREKGVFAQYSLHEYYKAPVLCVVRADECRAGIAGQWSELFCGYIHKYT